MVQYFNLQALADGKVTTAKLASNSVTIAKIASLGADPNADRILFWDDSAGNLAFLTAGTNLTISGTSLTATGGALSQFASGTNSVTGTTTEQELDTHTFTASDLGLNDFVFVVVKAECENDGTTQAKATIRVTDGTTTVDIDVDNATNASIAYCYIHNGLSTTNEWKRIIYGLQAYGVGTGDTADPILSARATMTVDQWITTAWTLSFRGAPNNAASVARFAWNAMSLKQ